MNSLPDSIGCLTALTTLSVAANQLTFLPTSFTALGSLVSLVIVLQTFGF